MSVDGVWICPRSCWWFPLFSELWSFSPTPTGWSSSGGAHTHTCIHIKIIIFVTIIFSLQLTYFTTFRTLLHSLNLFHQGLADLGNPLLLPRPHNVHHRPPQTGWDLHLCAEGIIIKAMLTITYLPFFPLVKCFEITMFFSDGLNFYDGCDQAGRPAPEWRSGDKLLRVLVQSNDIFSMKNVFQWPPRWTEYQWQACLLWRLHLLRAHHDPHHVSRMMVGSIVLAVIWCY